MSRERENVCQIHTAPNRSRYPLCVRRNRHRRNAGARRGQENSDHAKTLINDVFQIKIAESAEAAAAKLGIETERFGSSSDVAVEDQINIIEAVISRGEFGGIVLAATVTQGLGNVLAQAKEAGIYVVLVDSKTDGDDFVTVIQTDNVAAATVAADYSAKLIGEKGKVAMLEGEPGGETAAQRTKGFHDGIKKYPGIEIVSSITGHWTLPSGVEATEALIAANKDIALLPT